MHTKMSKPVMSNLEIVDARTQISSRSRKRYGNIGFEQEMPGLVNIFLPGNYSIGTIEQSAIRNTCKSVLVAQHHRKDFPTFRHPIWPAAPHSLGFKPPRGNVRFRDTEKARSLISSLDNISLPPTAPVTVWRQLSLSRRRHFSGAKDFDARTYRKP